MVFPLEPPPLSEPVPCDIVNVTGEFAAGAPVESFNNTTRGSLAIAPPDVICANKIWPWPETIVNDSPAPPPGVGVPNRKLKFCVRLPTVATTTPDPAVL